MKNRASTARSLLELDRVADRRDTGFGARLIGVAVRRTRDGDRADERALRPDHQSPADSDDLRQLANAARRLAGLRGRRELAGVAAKADGRVGLVDRRQRG